MQNPCMQNTEETIAKYAVDANLHQFFFSKMLEKNQFFFKVFKFTGKMRNRLERKKNQISDFLGGIFHKWNFPGRNFPRRNFHRWNLPTTAYTICNIIYLLQVTAKSIYVL